MIKINFSISNIFKNFGNQNNGLSIQRINQSVAKDNAAVKGNKNTYESQRKDRMNFSKEGRKTTFLEALNKQKQNIIEQKNKLVDDTLKAGGTFESIKEQLKTYEEQIKNVDKQIITALSKESQERLEENKKNQEERIKNNSKPKTEEELMSKKLTKITELATNIEQAETAHKVKAQIEGEARVLNSEIKMDGDRTELEINGIVEQSVGALNLIEKKEGNLLKMERKAIEIGTTVNDKVIKSIKEENENNKLQDVSEKDYNKKDVNEKNKSEN